MAETRQRIDTLLAERGLAASRTAAAASVRAGNVRIGADGPILARPSELVDPEADIVVAEPPRFVSRAGFKLENALEALDLDVTGLDCLDVGASTGGFTDCLLKRGAERVIALDVARGQIDQRLRDDPRVTVIERTNARAIDPAALPYAASLATIDVSFISLAKVIGPVAAAIRDDGELLVMVKPQFELGKGRVRGGVVRSAKDRREALGAVASAAMSGGLSVAGVASSELPGPKGNRETFLRLTRDASRALPDLDAEIARAEP
ncbi:TlyA family RNA methyltransferase [Thermoleophilia bacterium SCSIO 60948]|nr:TlyA family RNA methyltransferase [Thermoleophilia bacterium SCSIO 60948]